MKSKYYVLPFDLLHLAYHQRLFKPMILYMAMKDLGNGQIGIKHFNSRIDLYKNVIGIRSDKTIYNYLNKLIEQNWIGKNKNYFFIRSISTICKMQGIYRQRAYRFPISDLVFLQDFYLAACIHQLIISKKNEIWRSRRDHKKEVQFKSASHFYQISAASITKVFGISRQHVTSWRKRIDGKYFEMKVNLIIYKHTNGEPVKAMHIGQIKKYLVLCGEESKANMLRSHKGYVYVQGPNLIKSNIESCRRRY